MDNFCSNDLKKILTWLNKAYFQSRIQILESYFLLIKKLLRNYLYTSFQNCFIVYLHPRRTPGWKFGPASTSLSFWVLLACLLLSLQQRIRVSDPRHVKWIMNAYISAIFLHGRAEFAHLLLKYIALYLHVIFTLYTTRVFKITCHRQKMMHKFINLLKYILSLLQAYTHKIFISSSFKLLPSHAPYQKGKL